VVTESKPNNGDNRPMDNIRCDEISRTFRAKGGYV
jgi:hypothetical protein